MEFLFNIGVHKEFPYGISISHRRHNLIKLQRFHSLWNQSQMLVYVKPNDVS